MRKTQLIKISIVKLGLTACAIYGLLLNVEVE
jgi:hypothetical protein